MINLSDFQPLSIAKIKKFSSTTRFLQKIFSDKVRAILIEEVTIQTTLRDGASFRRLKSIIKPGSHMPPTYLGRGRRHGLGQRCGICEHLSPTHNLSQALIAGLPAKLNSAQLRRQVGGQCLKQIMCRR